MKRHATADAQVAAGLFGHRLCEAQGAAAFVTHTGVAGSLPNVGQPKDNAPDRIIAGASPTRIQDASNIICQACSAAAEACGFTEGIPAKVEDGGWWSAPDWEGEGVKFSDVATHANTARRYLRQPAHSANIACS
jgi:hypothetical protein